MKSINLFVLLVIFANGYCFSQQDSIVLIEISPKSFLITNVSNLHKKGIDTVKNPESFGPIDKYKFVVNQRTSLSFEITDTNGYSIIYKNWESVNEGNYAIEFSFFKQDFKSGIYYLIIVTDYKRIKKKIIFIK